MPINFAALAPSALIRTAALALWAILLAGASPASAAGAQADSSAGSSGSPGSSGSSQFTLSGFMTAAAGRILGGSQSPEVNGGWTCPCFIADYAQGGVYQDKGLAVRPDSKFGLQARLATVDQRYSITAQIVSRGARDGRVNVEWLYGTAELSSRLTLQAGRKRLPLFLYSDVQDVGLALPWIHLPPQLYGWEAVNYNGASLRYRDQIGDWTLNAHGFAGGESLHDAGYWKIYNGRDSRTDSRWSKVIGGEIKMSRGWLDLRGLMMQSNTQSRLVGVDDDYGPPLRQRIYGISVLTDFGGLFAGAEWLAIERRSDYGRDNAQLFWVGYRLGRWTPLLSYANYRLHPVDGQQPVEAHRTYSAVLRYDLGSSSAIKLQYDAWRDRSAPDFTSMHGNSRLLTVSYELVF